MLGLAAAEAAPPRTAYKRWGEEGLESSCDIHIYPKRIRSTMKCIEPRPHYLRTLDIPTSQYIHSNRGADRPLASPLLVTRTLSMKFLFLVDRRARGEEPR